MSKRNIKLYLDDIKDAIGKIEKYSKNLSFNKFSKNNLVIDAIVRNLEVIGEAAKNISVKFKDEYKDIPWNEIAGMRNIIVHEYFNVDLEILWKTIQQDIPKLKKAIKKIK
ncbi:MAG: hypothetical protein A3J65_00985 [Candidatus Buchananbacteria bacterium RIFCSPHIGHO2_02_FULL_45_11b]|uniref:DUF86 domain-containing protein n=2 Tax=Candidatus Buchananiibacteriota TaxID=1817903 RepID=A0A1G1Y4X5_9BACT|nr:MAG: hypothetical protein A2663_04075 [Candidatus Buchananbacteria bacterium RIFCSPHIGHO2_01_FULL_46_12]OGY52097.1 MAG: hypothetical protein A3J65_00985 [Candidatus Buchananbacteria bacterium RIFCSPHIGHO2_02_FULL_45_11b]